METKKRYATDFLFSTPSFLSGAATVINLAGDFYKFNSTVNGFEADELAIQNDFNMIGQDLFDIIEAVDFDNDKLNKIESRKYVR